MSFKVVRNALNEVVCFGSNTEQYQPTVGAGQMLSIEDDAPTPPAKTPDELRLIKYAKRYEAVKTIMSEFATENVARLVSGTWSLEQLVSLMSDPQLQELLNFINTLSFEIAIGKVQAITNPLITQTIKDGWAAKLQSHFYNT
jgi:hypothetical protein